MLGGERPGLSKQQLMTKNDLVKAGDGVRPANYGRKHREVRLKRDLRATEKTHKTALPSGVGGWVFSLRSRIPLSAFNMVLEPKFFNKLKS